MAQKTFIVRPHQQVCHRGVWYYEGDVFKSDATDLDTARVEPYQGTQPVAQRGEPGTVPHFVAETVKPDTAPAKSGKQKPTAGEEE